MEIMRILLTAIIEFALCWGIMGILLPYLFLPNFLFKQKLESSPDISSLAKRLKKKSKILTLKNTYRFVTSHFEDHRYEFDVRHLNRFYELFALHDYKVNQLILLHKRKFMWCYAQNKVLLTILKHTGQFTKDEIQIKINLSPHFTIHQYLLVKIGTKTIKIDPFYHIFYTQY